MTDGLTDDERQRLIERFGEPQNHDNHEGTVLQDTVLTPVDDLLANVEEIAAKAVIKCGHMNKENGDRDCDSEGVVHFELVEADKNSVLNSNAPVCPPHMLEFIEHLMTCPDHPSYMFTMVPRQVAELGERLEDERRRREGE